ncbi:MAG: T9SS type A sorting domain-containing protein, partial [Fidelibacterota bacterium]
DDNDENINCSILSISDSSICSGELSDDMLIISLKENANGTSSIILRADSKGKTVDEEFLVIVNPVNDAPEQFQLLSPANDSELIISSSSEDSVTFSWEESIDPDVGDDVIYSLLFFNETDTIIAETNIVGESVSYSDSLIYLIMEQNEVEQITGEWIVFATDGEFVTPSTDSKTLTIRQEVVAIDNEIAATEFNLYQNFPNPFNPTTQIKFSLPKRVLVKLSIYNINGKLMETLVDRQMNEGYHTITWDAGKYGSGIYFYQIKTADKLEFKKCMLIK